MNEHIDFKKKIINRIKKENITYREFITEKSSLYMYTVEITHKDGVLEENRYITAPKYTNDSILEQTYQLAHELGHHNINKNLNPRLSHFFLKLYSMNNIVIKNIIERKAWKEAIKICNEENIPITSCFYFIKKKCLDTYTNEVKYAIKHSCNIIFNVIKSYYIILLGCYLGYKGINDNIVDLFGVLDYFKGIDSQSVPYISKFIWMLYVIYLFIRLWFKKMHELI